MRRLVTISQCSACGVLMCGNSETQGSEEERHQLPFVAYVPQDRRSAQAEVKKSILQLSNGLSLYNIVYNASCGEETKRLRRSTRGGAFDVQQLDLAFGWIYQRIILSTATRSYYWWCDKIRTSVSWCQDYGHEMESRIAFELLPKELAFVFVIKL